MKYKRYLIASFMVATVLFLLAAEGFAADGVAGGWKRSTVAGKFPQKMVERYYLKSELPGKSVHSIAVCDGKIYFATERGIGVFDGNKWSTLESSGISLPTGVSRIQCGSAGGELRIGSESGLFIYSNGKAQQVSGVNRPVTAFAEFKKGLLIGTTTGMYFAENGVAKKIDEFDRLYITDIVVAQNGTVWVGTEQGLAKYDGAKAQYYKKSDDAATGLIHDNVRSIYLDPKGVLWVGTPVGISRFENGKWDYMTGLHGGLPYEDVLYITGENGTLWVGTTIGAARFDGKEWQYFQGRQYLGNDRVEAIAATSDGAWFGTPDGASKVWYEMMSLEQKAKYFEDMTRRNHNRFGLVSDSDLSVEGDYASSVVQTNDNDGLWTAMYIAAECYRYGATGDPEAKKFARESLDALMNLEKVTGIPGFMARSFAKPGDAHCQGEWDHLSSDGKWIWKGDTSSDEVDGHFYGYSVYYDVCADKDEKKEIAAVVDRIASYIVDNGFRLLDVDGKPTAFGYWDPEFFAGEGRFSRGLNSLQILSHLITAYHITGNEKFHDAYWKLIKDHHYAKFTVDQKLNQPYIINHSDDELAFIAYYPLLKYETHPFALEYFHKSLTRSWRIERPEKNPLWNFIYASEMPGDFAIDDALSTLQRIPIDVIRWDHRNSQRADLSKDQSAGRFAELQSLTAIKPDERMLTLWNTNPFQLDFEYARGKNEQPGTFFLLPYWMGRYYGYIVEQ